MDLLKPSERAERAVDTLGHYHITSKQTGGSVGDGVEGNVGETFFSSLIGYRLQIQDPAHVERSFSKG